MSTWLAGVTAVALPMVLESWRSRRNERRLLARGAVEPAGDVYRTMAIAYPFSFALMAGEGWSRGGPTGGWLVAGAVTFVLGKALKYWAIAALGPRWSFRVLVPPGAEMVRSGPYRWLNHPNYVGVAAELAGAWSWFGASWSGPMATASFLYLMWRRARIEDRALRAVPDGAGTSS